MSLFKKLFGIKEPKPILDCEELKPIPNWFKPGFKYESESNYLYNKDVSGEHAVILKRSCDVLGYDQLRIEKELQKLGCIIMEWHLIPNIWHLIPMNWNQVTSSDLDGIKYSIINFDEYGNKNVESDVSLSKDQTNYCVLSIMIYNDLIIKAKRNKDRQFDDAIKKAIGEMDD